MLRCRPSPASLAPTSKHWLASTLQRLPTLAVFQPDAVDFYQEHYHTINVQPMWKPLSRGQTTMTIAIVGEAIDFIANAQGEYRPHLGGSPYNVAIGLARNGESVSYLSPFSSDNFGELMHSSLRREGVQIPVQRRSRYPTSSSCHYQCKQTA